MLAWLQITHAQIPKGLYTKVILQLKCVRLHEPSCSHLFQFLEQRAKSSIGTLIGQDFSLKQISFNWERVAQNGKHSFSLTLSVMKFGTSTESECCTFLNPQTGVKCFFIRPYQSLNKYNILTCSLPDISYDALWKTTSIWWLVNIFLTSSLLVLSP